jgi:hypothetical protein
MAYGSALVDNIQSSTANTPVVFKDGNGTQIGTLCRAWVNFNGTGTVAIRASFNVSSITDNGTGDYTVNFTTALPDDKYSIHVDGAEGNANYARNASVPYQSAPTAADFRFAVADAGNLLVDVAYVYAAAFR